MLSPRRTAQLGLVSAAVVLVTSVSILVNGRESLRYQQEPAKTIAAQEHDQLVLGGTQLQR